MEGYSAKKTSLYRILQILREYSDEKHPLTQDMILGRLERDFGINLERKAVSRNIGYLRDMGFEIESCKEGGVYLAEREFEDSELRLLIDAVLSSRYISAAHSADIIKKLCAQSNIYFKNHVKNIYSVNEWGKTDNQELFLNIELIDEAIECGRQLEYDYNKYGPDKKLHKSSYQVVSPYQMILHNQRYYLLAYSEYWGNMVFHRLDHITNMKITEKKSVPIGSVPGYSHGLDYKQLSQTKPYMFTDAPETVEMIADNGTVDAIIDWFGPDVNIRKEDDGHVRVRLKASPAAMEYWALQYIRFTEVVAPESLRQRIIESLKEGAKIYGVEGIDQ